MVLFCCIQLLDMQNQWQFYYLFCTLLAINSWMKYVITFDKKKKQKSGIQFETHVLCTWLIPYIVTLVYRAELKRMPCPTEYCVIAQHGNQSSQRTQRQLGWIRRINFISLVIHYYPQWQISDTATNIQIMHSFCHYNLHCQ